MLASASCEKIIIDCVVFVVIIAPTFFSSQVQDQSVLREFPFSLQQPAETSLQTLNIILSDLYDWEHAGTDIQPTMGLDIQNINVFSSSAHSSPEFNTPVQIQFFYKAWALLSVCLI